MADTPIEIVWMLIVLSFALPVLMAMFDKSRTRIFLAMSLFLVGGMWIIFFTFMADNIVLSDDSLFPLSNEDGSMNEYKMFLNFIGVTFILMAIVVEVSERGVFK